MCFIFHKWGKWVDIAAGPITEDGVRIGSFIRQERRCERCGKCKLRMAETTT
jgi:hypothetical protein